MKNNFSENLIAIRESIGLSQKDLAEKSKLTKTKISKFENGTESPTLTDIDKIAKALKISSEELIFGSSIKQSSHSHRESRDIHRSYHQINNGWEFMARYWWVIFPIAWAIIWVIREIK